MKGRNKLLLIHEPFQRMSPSLTDNLDIVSLLLVNLQKIHLLYVINHAFLFDGHWLYQRRHDYLLMKLQQHAALHHEIEHLLDALLLGLNTCVNSQVRVLWSFIWV